MRQFKSPRQVWSILLILTVSSLGISSPSAADIIPTADLVMAEQLNGLRDQVGVMLEREDVAAALIDMGVDVDNAKSRVNSLTMTELQTLSSNMNTLPAGEGALGTIALVLVILILLDVAGVTDIFPAL